MKERKNIGTKKKKKLILGRCVPKPRPDYEAHHSEEHQINFDHHVFFNHTPKYKYTYPRPRAQLCNIITPGLPQWVSC